ncbi:alpha-L-glutamate ligase-like protein [Porticoccus sp.]|uniref:alpha-L-glutamate ligase-like protein n=1 Tax=Porticoccus sp. TaxID=2024853 RepID=UPI003F6A38DC
MKFISPGELRRLGVLGMNSRNVNYIGATNERHRFPLVDDKLKTKRLAQDHGMRVPKLFGVLTIQHEIQDLEKTLEGLERFVIKPAHGSGGKGILVIFERRDHEFIKSSGAVINLRDVKRHTSNILSGLYSLGGRSDVAMIEDMIIFDPLLSDFSYEGVPDIRVIVYRGFPVMAMMRCATHASDGKANLHQGAVGVGLDIETGTSACAVQNNARVDRHPDTGIGFDNLQLPRWEEILNLACGCYEMTGLGYFGADIVLDKYRGPMILELNARPGLAIQIANQDGLAKRLQAIDRLETVERSIEERTQLARTMFGRKSNAA